MIFQRAMGLLPRSGRAGSHRSDSRNTSSYTGWMARQEIHLHPDRRVLTNWCPARWYRRTVVLEAQTKRAWTGERHSSGSGPLVAPFEGLGRSPRTAMPTHCILQWRRRDSTEVVSPVPGNGAAGARGHTSQWWGSCCVDHTPAVSASRLLYDPSSSSPSAKPWWSRGRRLSLFSCPRDTHPLGQQQPGVVLDVGFHLNGQGPRDRRFSG